MTRVAAVLVAMGLGAAAQSCSSMSLTECAAAAPRCVYQTTRCIEMSCAALTIQSVCELSFDPKNPSEKCRWSGGKCAGGSSGGGGSPPTPPTPPTPPKPAGGCGSLSSLAKCVADTSCTWDVGASKCVMNTCEYFSSNAKGMLVKEVCEAYPNPQNKDEMCEWDGSSCVTPGGSGGLSGGAIAGIVIAVLLVVASIGAAVFFLVVRKRTLSKQQPVIVSQGNEMENYHNM